MDRNDLSPKTYRRGMAALLLLAATLRLALLITQSLTMDEVKDLGMARGGWAAISGTENRFPPLYHTLLWGWLKALPDDDTGRGFSVLCGVLTVACIGGLGKLIGGPRGGLWGAAIAAVAPFAIWHATEVRVYALYMLLGAAAIWQFTAAWLEDRPRNWVAFVLCAIAGVYTHYYFGQLIVAAGLLWLSAKPPATADLRQAGVSRKRGFLAFGVIGAACIPAALMLLGDLDQAWGYAKTSEFGALPLGYTYFSFLSGYTLGVPLGLLHTVSGWEAVQRFLPWIAVLGCVTLYLVGAALAARSLAMRRQWIAWFAAFCLAPPLIIGVVSRVAGFGFSPRHVAWCFAPLAALLGAGIAARPKALDMRLAAAALAAAFGVAQFNREALGPYRNEDARKAAVVIVEADNGARAPVFALSGYMRDPLEFYLPKGWPAFWLPDAAFPTDKAPVMQQAQEMIREKVSPGDKFWLAYSREFHGDPDGSILAALEKEFDLRKYARVDGVVLYRGAR